MKSRKEVLRQWLFKVNSRTAGGFLPLTLMSEIRKGKTGDHNN